MKTNQEKLWRVTKADANKQELKADNMVVTGGGSLVAVALSGDKQTTMGAWSPGSWDKVEQIDNHGKTLCCL